ncbi:MAG TPA: MEKHLA domain-containing protein [Nitrospiraceae bacterium]|nr:MEKHLA domain-containing protein [Nitrospiraceae bacterium]
MELGTSTTAWWTRPEQIEWVQSLLTSYHHWTGRELIERDGSADQQASALFSAPFVVVSHGGQTDPLLNYGNRAALDLFEMTWEDLCRTPSRLTAEPIEQAERARMLTEARARGYIVDYRGVRISKTGRRFIVEHALVWNVLTADGMLAGQAATFSQWKRLD